jgi:glycosyltransferase involved in cell wall biosynthesis
VTSALRHRPRVLLIGPRPRPGEPIGGAQVSFDELCEGFERSGAFAIDVVDTTRSHTYSRGLRRGLGNALGLARTLLALLRRGPLADLVMFNASSNGVIQAGPWIESLCRWMGKPLAIRAFGGALDLTLDRASPRRRARLLDVLRSASLVLLQTDHLCARFAGCGDVRKLPTTRRSTPTARQLSQQCRRFVFVAQLRPEKGYEEALRAIESCPPECTLDLYGPSMPSTDLMRLRSHPRAVYHGALPHDRVARVLGDYDALLFPSYYEGEGLPGVIVEAMQCGLPVIAAQWRALPELVQNELNGLLVTPKSSASLAAAMLRLASDDALFAELCIGALERGRELDASSWQLRLERWLLELCGQAPVPANVPTPHREVLP